MEVFPVFSQDRFFSMTAEQIVDNPVPRPGGAGDLQGFPSGQGATAFSEQIAEFPDPGGGRHDFQPVQGSAASSSDSPGQAGEAVFSHFSPPEKKCEDPALGAESSSWTPWGLCGGTTWGAASSPCC